MLSYRVRNLSFFLYILPDPPFEYYWQVYFVHSRLQDESLKVTISKLPQGSLACTVGDFPCTGDIQLTSRSEGRFTKTNLQHLQCNDRAMIRQICSIKPEDVGRVRSSELLAKLQLEDLNLILRERRLRWFGHVARSSGAISTAYDMQIDGKRGAGRPKQTWKKLTGKDCREWKLTIVDPQERSTWRSGVRSAMRAASQLPGKGPTDVDDAPAPAR